MKTTLITPSIREDLVDVLDTYLSRCLPGECAGTAEAARAAVEAGLEALPDGVGEDAGVPCEWDGEAAFAALAAAGLPGACEAGLRACVRALEWLLQPRICPSASVSEQVLRGQCHGSDLDPWVDDLPVMLAHPGFCRFCASVVEAAAQDPEGFAERNVEWLAANPRGTSRQRKAEAATLGRFRDALDRLASRPLHPAWPAVVIAAMAAPAVEWMRSETLRITSGRSGPGTMDALVLGGSFVCRDEEEVAGRVPKDMLRVLHTMPNSSLAWLADETLGRVGGVLRAAGQADALDAIPDMPEPSFGLFGEPSVLDRDGLPETYLCDPDRGAWLPLDRTADDAVIDGIYRRVFARPADAAGMLAELAGLAGNAGTLDARGLFPGADEASVIHVVGLGPEPYEAMPVIGVRADYAVEAEGAGTTLRVTFRGSNVVPDVTEEQASVLLACALASTLRSTIRARRDMPGWKDGIRVTFDWTAIEAAFPSLGPHLEGLTERSSVAPPDDMAEFVAR